MTLATISNIVSDEAHSFTDADIAGFHEKLATIMDMEKALFYGTADVGSGLQAFVKTNVAEPQSLSYITVVGWSEDNLVPRIEDPTQAISLHDVLFVLEQAKRRLIKHGWARKTWRDILSGGICLGTALGGPSEGVAQVVFRDVNTAAVQRVAAALGRPYARGEALNHVVRWNDLPERTFGDVLCLLDRVIADTHHEILASRNIGHELATSA